MIEYAVMRLNQESPAGFSDFLGHDVSLVPMPASAPVWPKGSGYLWVARRICEELVAIGLGRTVLPVLERVHRVPKSAYSPPEVRPLPATHFDSFRVNHSLANLGRVTLVDDVITQGATALAGASRLAEARPDVPVRVFTLLRTRGRVHEIDRIIDPVTGWIRHRNGHAFRDRD